MTDLPSAERARRGADAARSLWVRTQRALFQERDAAGLVAFRVMFGLLGLVSAGRFLAYGWVEEFFVRPRFFFRAWFAPFVEPLGSAGMHAVFWTMAAASALVALGLFYRAAIVTVFVTLTYVQLVDLTNYLNHYYLLSLLALLMAFMPLGQVGSLDAVLFGARRGGATLPAWCWTLLRLQVGLVYTYAGVAKVTPDWLLHAQPLDIWLSSRTSTPLLGPLLALPGAPYAMSWAGCLFDLTIAWWLLARRTRPYAFVVVLGFHAVTRALFPIGMFPFIMVVGATVFFDPGWPRRVLRLVGRVTSPAEGTGGSAPASGRARLRVAGLALASSFMLVQLGAPLRAFLYGGDVHWHEQGMRLSWRVMVREKNASVTYLVKNRESGRVTEVHPRRYLDARQQREFSTQPDMIVTLAHHIAADEAARQGAPVSVYVDAVASLNGRPAARLIDPSVDLSAVADGLAPHAWILPAPPGAPPSLRRSSWSIASTAP